MPTVFSKSSVPVYLERFHSPSFSAECAAGMWRARLRMWPTVSSAAEMMFEVGALTTMTPAAVAALMSTLSSPTPARATTFSFGAAAMASASTFVAERTSTASASASAASSADGRCRRLADVEVGPEGLDRGGREFFGDEYDGFGGCHR